MTTKSQTAAADVAALLRARNPLLWITTREEARVEACLYEAAASANYLARTWDVAQGMADMGQRGDANTKDPASALDAIEDLARNGSDRCAWIMRDLPVWLRDMAGATTCRQLRNLARMLPTVPRDRAQAIIVISPSGDVPAELTNHATVIDWPNPDRQEIATILDAAVNGLPEELKATAATNGTREAAIDAAVGLSGEEAAACYARSLVQLRKIDPATVASEKKRVIARDGLLEWYDPLPLGLDAVGGLDQLKSWVLTRKSAYTPAARAYGLPAPKGVFLVGISGCGKSLCAKATATALNSPLIKLDLNGAKSKFVGESEANIRRAFATIASIGKCVVWIDEIEKALSGAVNGAADGGVSSDALGTFLTWMQEKSGEAFVIATANDISQLPPELLRKGRFDELFFVDLPNQTERIEIVATALRAHNRKCEGIDLGAVAKACDAFTGSEVAALIPDALFRSFADGARALTTADLTMAASTVAPLSKTAAEKINALRAWAVGKTRSATTADVRTQTTSARQLDI